MVNPEQETFAIEATAAGGSADPLDVLPVPYIEVDTRGEIVRANARVYAIFGLSGQELLGRSGWDLLAGDEVKESQEEFKRILQSHEESADEPTPVRRSVQAKNGEYRTFDLYRSVIRGTGIHGSGEALGMRYVAIDVTEAVAAHEEAERGRLWLESVIDSVGEAVLISDVLGFVRSANPAVEALIGWRPAELMGKAVEKFMPVLSYEPADGIPLSHHAMLEQRLRGTATILDRKRYQLRVEIASSPVVDKESGYTAGVVRILRRLPEAQP